MLEPSIRGMLELGKNCGLSMLEEAYKNYMLHYDCFFLIANYEEQYNKFKKDIDMQGWIDLNGYLIKTTIEDCLKQLDGIK